MSTFRGKIAEFPHISIDRFDGDNLQSSLFFLSHCHSDHMHGLDDLLAKAPNAPLYMSPVSAAILKRFKPHRLNIKELDPTSPTKIDRISVQTIPAGHCPGSVMFLFESETKTILYTGDFRLNPSDLPKIIPFYNSSNTLKLFDEVYLDTTFFLSEYKWFPRRDESLQKVCDLITDWISKSPTNVAHLKTSATYGYEFLFTEIASRFKMPVFIDKGDVLEFYSLIPEMDNAVTDDASRSQISAGLQGVYNDERVKNVRISAMAWNSNSLDTGISDESRVCYSTHASYEECWEFLTFLKPKRVEPNVDYRNQPKKRAQLLDNLRKCINSYSKVEQTVEEVKPRVKLFKIDQNVKRDAIKPAEGLLLSSPPRRRRF